MEYKQLIMLLAIVALFSGVVTAVVPVYADDDDDEDDDDGNQANGLIKEYIRLIEKFDQSSKIIDESIVTDFLKERLTELRTDTEILLEDEKDELRILDKAIRRIDKAEQGVLDLNERRADKELTHARKLLSDYISELEDLKQSSISLREITSPLLEKARDALDQSRFREADAANLIDKSSLAITSEFIDMINSDLTRFEEIVIELQLDGFSGQATAKRVNFEVGVFEFFNSSTSKTLFEIQIPNGALGIFGAIGTVEELVEEGKDVQVNDIAALLITFPGLVDFVTASNDDETAKELILRTIIQFHPSTGNTTFPPVSDTIPLLEQVENFLKDPSSICGETNSFVIENRLVDSDICRKVFQATLNLLIEFEVIEGFDAEDAFKVLTTQIEALAGGGGLSPNIVSLHFEQTEVFTVPQESLFNDPEILALWRVVKDPGTSNNDILLLAQFITGNIRMVDGDRFVHFGFYISEDGIEWRSVETISTGSKTFVKRENSLLGRVLFNDERFFAFGANTNEIDETGELKDFSGTVITVLPAGFSLERIL